MDPPHRPSVHAALLVATTRQHANEVREAAARARQVIAETMALIAKIDATTPWITPRTGKDHFTGGPDR